ncbi:MAG: type I-E CRISPR-associated protein Cas7/Cse4/CasC [Candidatus Binatia bacterium]
MSDARFVQIHFLTSYPASLLNRDDVGFAKRIPFGGVTRTRISSQCLKRHWRTFDGEHALASVAGIAPSVRSRVTFNRLVYDPLVRDGIQPELAKAATAALMAEVLGESAKAKKEKAQAKEKGADDVETGQVTVLGRPEIDFLLTEARAICQAASEPGKVADAAKTLFTKERRENLRALKRGAGLDAALFGRMVTSDILARCDAAIHVAHAFTVHAEAAESDYFSVVDDLLQTGDQAELGSGHIGTSELTSGLYYGYVVADVPLLVSNLEGCVQEAWTAADRSLAADVIGRLVYLLATVSPGAKLGSTAPHAYANFVLVECGTAQPRTLANAFLAPVKERSDLLANAYRALVTHLGELDAMYGATIRRVAAIGPKTVLDPALPEAVRVANLSALAEWAAQQVRGQA